MWPAIICGLIIYKLFKCFFYDDDVLDIEASDSTVLFSVANRFYLFIHFEFNPFMISIIELNLKDQIC